MLGSRHSREFAVEALPTLHYWHGTKGQQLFYKPRGLPDETPFMGKLSNPGDTEIRDSDGQRRFIQTRQMAIIVDKTSPEFSGLDDIVPTASVIEKDERGNELVRWTIQTVDKFHPSYQMAVLHASAPTAYTVENRFRE